MFARELRTRIVCLFIVCAGVTLCVKSAAGDKPGGGLFDFGHDGADSRPSTSHPSATEAATTAPAERVTIHIEATIDGSDIVTITAKGAHWEHKSWTPATDVRINNVEWDTQDRADLPSDGVLKFLSAVDFSTAKVVSRSGRDIVAMERTDDGITIYFADAPEGSGHYTIKVSLLKKQTE